MHCLVECQINLHKISPDYKEINKIMYKVTDFVLF